MQGHAARTFWTRGTGGQFPEGELPSPSLPVGLHPRQSQDHGVISLNELPGWPTPRRLGVSGQADGSSTGHLVVIAFVGSVLVVCWLTQGLTN